MNFEIFYRQKGADEKSNIKHTYTNRFEILQVFHGKGNVLAGTKIFPMIPGALYLIDCSKPQCTQPYSPDEYVRNKILLDKDALVAFLYSVFCYDTVEEAMIDGGMCITFDADTSSKLDSFFYSAHKNSHDPSAVMYEVFKIFLTIKNNALPIEHYDTGIVGRTVKYIDDNISETISTSRIAKHLHVSEYHLCHEFRRRTGTTISEYTASKRLSEAKKILIDTNKTVSEISTELGFSSFSYFCKIFKEKNGMTPSEFRERGRTNL